METPTSSASAIAFRFSPVAVRSSSRRADRSTLASSLFTEVHQGSEAMESNHSDPVLANENPKMGVDLKICGIVPSIQLDYTARRRLYQTGELEQRGAP